MTYSKQALNFILRLFNIKKSWNISLEKIEKKRKLISLVGYTNPPRSNSKLSVRKLSFGDNIYYELMPKSSNIKNSIFYSHGGGYVYEITKLHWRFLAELCIKGNNRIIVPIYPLPPGTNKDKVFNLLYSLLNHILDPDKKLVLMGDSAGGGLSLSLAIKAMSEGIDVANTVLISPWLDINMNSPEMIEINNIDPLLDCYGLVKCGQYYMQDCEDDYMSSPLNADFSSIKGINIFTGSHDILYPQAKFLAGICKNKNIPYKLYEYKECIHIFLLFATPESKAAREQIIDILQNI